MCYNLVGDTMILFEKFEDTIFLKESSDLQDRYDALLRLKDEFPNNEDISEEMFIIKKGLDGEKEIKYQLSKSNLGLFVLNDINIEYEDLKAQIDYVVITKMYCYFIECKNLIGNVTVNEKGDFIREYTFSNKKVKKGMYSPLRQVEAQRDVYKKIWNNRLSKNKILNTIRRFLSNDGFTNTHRVLVVAANNETILNTKYAPKDIKPKVIKADALIRTIQNDLKQSDKDLWESKKQMEEWANTFLKINVNKDVDYYEYYKEQFNLESSNNDDKLKEKLLEFRKSRSKELNIPAYYVYNNDELDLLVKAKPKTLEELKSLSILSSVKINTHGKLIIEIINNK